MTSLSDQQKAIIRSNPIDPAELTQFCNYYFSIVHKLPLNFSYDNIARLAIEGQDGTFYRFNA